MHTRGRAEALANWVTYRVTVGWVASQVCVANDHRLDGEKGNWLLGSTLINFFWTRDCVCNVQIILAWICTAKREIFAREKFSRSLRPTAACENFFSHKFNADDELRKPSTLSSSRGSSNSTENWPIAVAETPSKLRWILATYDQPGSREPDSALVVCCGLLAKWLIVRLRVRVRLGPGNALAVHFFPLGYQCGEHFCLRWLAIQSP